MTAPGAHDATSAWLHELLGREPRQPALFLAALTHRSATDDNNERLEFLGDAVLGLLIAEELYRRFPDADEGDLSRLRSRLVSAGPLAQIGARIGIGAELRLGSGELRTGGFRRESILADATEALFGAVYLDGSLADVRALVLRLYEGMLAELQPDSELKDSKTRLQEMLQGRGEALPGYVLESAVGEPHAQTFAVRCVVQLSGEARPIEATGSGSGRRRAEQQAAAGVLEQLTARWQS
ncbi:MAG TPA: ribonuclease III [Steroidobacteraceae bacterium]|nr:ribonuclease III [Steroidobacteraceae bacterium]